MRRSAAPPDRVGPGTRRCPAGSNGSARGARPSSATRRRWSPSAPDLVDHDRAGRRRHGPARPGRPRGCRVTDDPCGEVDDERAGREAAAGAVRDETIRVSPTSRRVAGSATISNRIHARIEGPGTGRRSRRTTGRRGSNPSSLQAKLREPRLPEASVGARSGQGPGPLCPVRRGGGARHRGLPVSGGRPGISNSVAPSGASVARRTTASRGPDRPGAAGVHVDQRQARLPAVIGAYQHGAAERPRRERLGVEVQRREPRPAEPTTSVAGPSAPHRR